MAKKSCRVNIHVDLLRTLLHGKIKICTNFFVEINAISKRCDERNGNMPMNMK